MIRPICTYKKDEILKVIAEHAGSFLKNESNGVLRAIFKDDGTIEVLFISEDKLSLNN